MATEQSLLLSAREAASLMGFSLRTIHHLRKREDFPKPIVLGPRAVRWRRRDIEAWINGLTPNNANLPEPPQLARSRRQPFRPPSPFDGKIFP